jgi:hypothetical protein
MEGIYMPELARFYGMVVKMYFAQKEHNPPHIHVIYGDYMSAIDIQTLDVLEGDLPEKALNLVKEWIQQHQSEILEIWSTQQFKKVAPLE